MNSAATSLADVRKIPGHATPGITADLYNHLSLEAKAVPMDRLDVALSI